MAIYEAVSIGLDIRAALYLINPYGVTVTVADALAVPPMPVHLRA